MPLPQTTQPTASAGQLAQVSDVCWTPSPQVSMRQAAEQPSFEVLLPSSHSSVPWSWPLPQTGLIVQVLLQESPLTSLPSSHCSLVCVIASPQTSSWQVAEQPSLLTVLPSSQPSPLS